MDTVISKCGLTCSSCPTYKENILTFADRERCSAGWAKYLGIHLSPEKIRLCDGCQTPDEQNPVRYINCYVRKCAMQNNVETCAHCSEYPCPELIKMQLPVNVREEISSKLGIQIPEQDYLIFIEPYEGIKHLDQIRTTLNVSDIVKAQKKSAIARIKEFPANWSISAKKISTFKTIYHLLATLESEGDVTHARKQILSKRRDHLLKLLWSFGLFGSVKKKAGLLLMLDGNTYLNQKIHSGYEKLQEYLAILKEYDIHCAIVPLKEVGWLTPSGALRREGWYLEMRFGKKLGGDTTLKAFTVYVRLLNTKFGIKAYKYFKQVDMYILV
jgi:hypothetical protein